MIIGNLFKTISRYKDLIWHLTKSELKSNVARTYMGFFWWILDPLLYMCIFYFLVHVILDRGGPDYPVFLFIALIPLKWTTSCLVDATNSIQSKGNIIKQIYVPKVVFVLVKLSINTIKFLISLTVLLIFLVVYGDSLSIFSLLLPFILLLHLCWLFPMMLILAHIGVYFKDIKNLMQYVTRVLLYVSPVLYSLSTVPEEIVKYLYINPLTLLIVSYRNILMYQDSPLTLELGILLIASIIFTLVGLHLIYKYDKKYVKVI
ncbi:ABC transporter permease [Halobacillus litoralis]|uniref:ABC transporter permease n=1 Tax=Halobacillus litoralis TaxID=45668 RepID=UPI001CD35195|nr:ABC transporter permease [Halobacillus litoralis]